MQRILRGATLAAACLAVLAPARSHAAEDRRSEIATIVSDVIQPVQQRYGIPGLAVGIAVDGKGYVYDYGVSSKATGQPVTDDTLFELGSVSKTFTATLASYAQTLGRLSLSDAASKALPSLRGTSLDRVTLLNLGTHTTGGMPLQVPDAVTNDDQLMRYFHDWTPTSPPGTIRTYANPSIGLLGLIAAKSLGDDFDRLMERRLFPALGLQHAYLHVPADKMADYAQGYTKADVPIRMAPGVLGSEAYGIRTTAGDVLRFVQANMGLVDLDEDVQRAVTATHTGYFRLGAMTQDLIWEQYGYPVGLKDLLDGNSAKVGLEANSVFSLDPPEPPQEHVLIDKTGSTNGFAAYVAFVPDRKLGLVILANKNYPIEARVTAASAILTRLDRQDAGH